MRMNSTMKSGTATTTIHAPWVNFEIRKITVATPVTIAPVPLTDGAIAPPRRALSPPVHHETRLREREARKDPDGEERNHLVGVPADRDEQESPTATPRTQMPLLKTCRSPRRPKMCGQVVIARKKTAEDGQSPKGRIRGQSEDHRDGERDDVVRPVATDGQSHDLTEDGLLRTRADVPAVREHCETEEHRAENDAEHQLRSLRASMPAVP